MSTDPAMVKAMPAMRHRLSDSFNKNRAAKPTHSGVVATSAADEATVVCSSDWIQVAKCIAKQIPEIIANPA